MAAFSHSRVGSRSSLINCGGFGSIEQSNGSCNYRDLSVGTSGLVCGCQRFYLNNSHWQRQGQHAGQEEAWCYCGHHACFHNVTSQLPLAQEQVTENSGLVEVDDIRYSCSQGNIRQPGFSSQGKVLAGLGIRDGSHLPSQSIETRVFDALNGFARNQADGGLSDTTSKLPSSAAPSVVEESRLSPNRLIQERAQHYRSMGPPVNIPQPTIPRPAEDYSATEVATPSIAGTPDFRALASSSNKATTSPARLRPTRFESARVVENTSLRPTETRQGPSKPTPAGSAAPIDDSAAIRDLQDMHREYCRRLEALEGLSYSHVPLEEVQDRFELLEMRILELEQWHREQENCQTSTAYNRNNGSPRHHSGDEEGSFASDASFDSNAAAHADAAVLATIAATAETHPRIDALESRVTDLENVALPSFARPWHVQVVLLPWSRELRGIWFSSVEATKRASHFATQASEEWQGADTRTQLSFKSSLNGAWTTESIEAWANDAQEWLSPKACGPSGMVFQRLASRGLVRNINLTAPDGRHILSALDECFGSTLVDSNETAAESASRYQALQEKFIPLRKIRKSSRLRFLSPAEMTTSATWTAGFLDSSVFMKVNDWQRRLYLTTPGAYMQSSDGEWNWERIRDLADARGELQTFEGQSAPNEACWTHNEQLDQPPSGHSSFAFQLSQGSRHSAVERAQADSRAEQPVSPTSFARLLRQRTVSFPSSTSNSPLINEAIPKRRVASFEPVSSIPIEEYQEVQESATKRRRISMSPEAERRGVNFTPRWSREPPSPFTSEAAAEARSQGTSNRKRGTTPFAYATPHSNSNFIGRFEFTTGDGDTEADTEVLADHSDRGEEAWEGVDDDHTYAQGQESDDESSMDDAKSADHEMQDEI